MYVGWGKYRLRGKLEQIIKGRRSYVKGVGHDSEANIENEGLRHLCIQFFWIQVMLVGMGESDLEVRKDEIWDIKSSLLNHLLKNLAVPVSQNLISPPVLPLFGLA